MSESYGKDFTFNQFSVSNVKSELLSFIGQEIDKEHHTANADEAWWKEKSKEYPQSYCCDINKHTVLMEFDWWDINLEDVQNVYCDNKSVVKNAHGPIESTIPCGGIITKESGNNYLYICSALFVVK